MKSLDAKLAEIRARRNSRAFILADAKDADMAYGVRATGPRSYLARRGARPAQFSPEVWTREEFGFRNLPEFLDIIREVTHQGLVDIMLMSAYVNEQLTIKEGLFQNSHVTPAARANDTTDVWAARHGCYMGEASQPFRSASIDHIQCGEVACDRSGGKDFPGANLGLYSITYVNDLEQDREALLAYKEFREEAERKGFRHFLEVFDPNVDSGIPAEKLGEFVNDNILRTLAGVPDAGRPLFLKVVYHGPRAMEELCQYDPNMVVGIMGGGAGTTYDAFKLIHDAQKYGARAALFGRKINQAEHQLAFIEMLRLITDGQIGPEEAVRAYHGVLQGKGIQPHRSLAEDLQPTAQSMNYAGTVPASGRRSDPPASAAARPPGTGGAVADWPRRADGSPDFARMNSQQRLAYDQARLQL
ncbi:MAG TPA: hypothetical protein PKN95_12300 [Verrucomicrobiota bacterium]|nr:hypothetical protein [Verrucomicrobiota bacterium]HNT14250.1 hypothetical protein [Verrucomicrobiota bacterium]